MNSADGYSKVLSTTAQGQIAGINDRSTHFDSGSHSSEAPLGISKHILNMKQRHALSLAQTFLNVGQRRWHRQQTDRTPLLTQTQRMRFVS